MAQTKLAQQMAAWPDPTKAQFKSDLSKLTSVPFSVLRDIVERIGKSYPCCNYVELAMIAGAKLGLADPQEIVDVVTAWTFIWTNLDGESPEALTTDLRGLGFVSQQAGDILQTLLIAAEPFRETGQVSSNYLRIGSPLFVDINGTVDIRCRFHKTTAEFTSARTPKELVGLQQVILANLRINSIEKNEQVVSFLMDESDLNLLKRFINNMERELELTKHLMRVQNNAWGLTPTQESRGPRRPRRRPPTSSTWTGQYCFRSEQICWSACRLWSTAITFV